MSSGARAGKLQRGSERVPEREPEGAAHDAIGAPMDLADRVVGSALGLALGDALGAPFEFLRARNIPDPIPALERPWLGEPPGSTTDDTAMARNLMRSLVARGGLDQADVLERHLEWFRSDPPDVGTLTGRVLRRIAAGEPPDAAAQSIWNERGPEVWPATARSCTARPLGLAYANRPEQLLELAPGPLRPHARRRPLPDGVHRDHAQRRGARPRRARPRRRAALVASPRSRTCEGGEELEFLVEQAGVLARDRRPRSGVLPVHGRRSRSRSPPRPGDAEDGLRHVVSLGGDTDTNAAVTGALLGALRRPGRGFPPAWLERLLGADREVRIEAEALVPLAERAERRPRRHPAA